MEIENLMVTSNYHRTNRKITKELHINAPCAHCFIEELYQTFKDHIIPVVLKLLQSIEKRENSQKFL